MIDAIFDGLPGCGSVRATWLWLRAGLPFPLQTRRISAWPSR